ncbi:MAG TPA: zf-TFIIB domain-containing protein [Gemmatimonadaceae bacterium]|nr:zf-TFIIB domain-containing protein [Gemmatimonadaceae bacterium]
MLHCPVDHTELVEHVTEHLAFATCSKCNGLWLPRSARTELLDPGKVPLASRVAQDAKRTARKRYGCPRCKKSFRPERVEGIEIDRCMQCEGIWLDAGEYDAVKQRIELNNDPARPKKKLKVEEGGPIEIAIQVVLALLEVLWVP